MSQPGDRYGDVVVDLQIRGGKRYDLATQGRRRANANLCGADGTDVATPVNCAMDRTPLVDHDLDPARLIGAAIERVRKDVTAKIAKYSGASR